MTETAYPKRGVEQALAARLLKAEPRQINIDGNPAILLENDDASISAFCRQGKVYSVRIQAPFEEAIRGIKIGDDCAAVESKLGSPTRPWPIQDGVTRWLYDTPEFMRIDFSVLGRVTQIFL